MRRILEYFKHHGLWRTTHRVVHSACNRAFRYNTFVVMWMPTSFTPEPIDLTSERLEIRKLGREEAFAVSRLPGSGMPEAYVEEALARGDECFGVTIEEEPVCVSWFARRGPVTIYRWWNVEFFGDYVYVHAVYTSPAYRGRRLAEKNLHAAVKRYALAGATGMFALVESSNYASLNAFRRAGYTPRATIRTAQIGGRLLVRHDSECVSAQVFVRPRPDLKVTEASSESITHAA